MRTRWLIALRRCGFCRPRARMWRLASATRRIAERAATNALQCRAHMAAAQRAVAASASTSMRRFSSRTLPFTAQEQALLQEAMRKFAQEEAESAEVEASVPRPPALPRPSRADLAVIVRASPVFELSYSAHGEHCTAIWLMHDHKWFAAHRADADLVVTDASSLELLTITRQPRQQDAQLQARQAALEVLCSRGVTVDPSFAVANPVAALLQASRQLAPSALRQSPDVLAASAAIQGLNLVQLGHLWANHSRDALRLFLRSFVQHVQHNAALQLQTESELKPAPAAPAQAAVSAPTAARDPTSLLPPLQPQSFVDAASVRVPLRAPNLDQLQLQSRDERYRAIVRLSLEQMLRTLYPDPHTAKDATEAESFLQRRRAYVSQLQWPSHCAEDAAEFARRFLTPRRIELHVQVHDTVNAYEQQMLLEWFRRPGDFAPTAKPRVEGRLAARRSAAGHIMQLQQSMPSGFVAPAPFSSLRAASLAAANLDHAAFRSEQVACLFDIVSRDQAVLHAVPLFGPAEQSTPPRKHIHAMFHSRMRTALMQRAATEEQFASLAMLQARDTNQRFMQQFGRGSTAAAAVLATATVESSADVQPTMSELLSSVDDAALHMLHDRALSQLSRDLDLPECAIRFALHQIDAQVSAAYRRELYSVSKQRGLGRIAATQLWRQKRQEQRIVKRNAQQSLDEDQAEDDSADNAQQGGIEDELEPDDDVEAEEDAFDAPQAVDKARASAAHPSLSADQARELHDHVHSTLVVRDSAYAACDGVFVSLFPLSGGSWNRFKRDFEILRLDVRKAVLLQGPEALRQGQPTQHPQTAIQSAAPSDASRSANTPEHAPRFYRDGASSLRRHRAPSSSSSPINTRRMLRSRLLADEFASLVLSHLSELVPGGVRLTTESWLQQYGSPVWDASHSPLGSPDLLLLDDVSIVVHYPRVDDPERPQPRRATRMMPLRWVEVKNSYGALMHYRAMDHSSMLRPQNQPEPPASAAPLTWMSPSRAALVEQSSRYAALFGPGCVVFGRGFSDAWLRPCSATSDGVPMPDDVHFLDAQALVQVIKAELKSG